MAGQCMVGEHIFRNYSYLRTLAKTNSNKKRLKLLQNASTDQLLAVVEAARNVVCYQTFCLNKTQKKKILPFKKYLRKLGLADEEEDAVKIIQKGGSVAWIPALLIPVLQEVVRSLFN